jgi:SAM-dependent methyltransferase
VATSLHLTLGYRQRLRGNAVRVRRHLLRIPMHFRADRRQYVCPVCQRSPVTFLHRRFSAGARLWAECGGCGALERHRIQAEVLSTVPQAVGKVQPSTRWLQLAPDPMTPWLRNRVGTLITLDLEDSRASIRADAKALPFSENTFDGVLASHVLEHIPDYRSAVAELSRVLVPGGVALLPVPIIAPETVEYGCANPTEEFHVRAPGLDMLESYRDFFETVGIVSSEDVRPEIQPWYYEDRSSFPTAAAPNRPAMMGDRHADFVPVCVK